MLAGLAAVVALFTILWLVSLAVRKTSIVDMWWGPGILLIGLAYMFSTDGDRMQSTLVVTLLALWAVRLAWHIGARNIGHGEDFRYAKWRAGARRLLVVVQLLQGVSAAGHGGVDHYHAAAAAPVAAPTPPGARRRWTTSQ